MGGIINQKPQLLPSFYHSIHSKHSLTLEPSLELWEQLSHLGLLHVLSDCVEWLGESDFLDGLGSASRGLWGGGDPFVVLLDGGAADRLCAGLAGLTVLARGARGVRVARGDGDHLCRARLEGLHSHCLSCVVAMCLSAMGAEERGTGSTYTPLSGLA
jgi:hypothetical protein